MSKQSPSSNQPFDPSRRRLLTGMAAAGAAGIAASCSSSSAPLPPLPAPQDSGIDHIVVVMMENRSFDSVLGWVPGANGVQEGLSFVDKAGNRQQSFRLPTSTYGFQGCGYADPDHSYQGARTQLNGGSMDGFLKTQPDTDLFPIGYYTRDDVKFFAGCADHWTICDAYHCGILSCTLPNRMYMHTGQTDRITNSFNLCYLPTIWDSLLAKGVSARYYYADTPVIALMSNFSAYKNADMVQKLSQFATDFGPDGTPPAVSYVDPYMGLAIGEALGTSWDDHAFADIRNGQSFLNYIYNVIRNSPNWAKTLLIINYDEWGGFYDHVAPAMAPVGSADMRAGNDGSLGFRVPCIAIGPRAPRGSVSKLQFDPNSILNMICWRFGMDPLGVRGGSLNFAHALDFSSSTPDLTAPEFDVSYDGSPGPMPTAAPFAPPSSTGSAQNVFGAKCDGTPGPTISLQGLIPEASPEVVRRMEQHYAEVRTLQDMGRNLGLDI